MPEQIDRRYLGALKCVDRATGFHLNRRFTLIAEDLSFQRNRSNLYVINNATGLEQHRDSFAQPPPLPATGSLPFSVVVSDPIHNYLPRSIQIDLPRDPNPANAIDEASLFNPVSVQLYAAPNAKLMANWSTVRASILREDSESGLLPVAGALLRVIRNSDDEILSSGMSDERGEALVIVPGVPITQFADEEDEDRPGRPRDPAPVVISEIPVRVEVSIAANTGWPTNPDLLELNHAANLVVTESLALRTGRMEKLTIQLT